MISICKPNEDITGTNAQLAFSTSDSDYYCVGGNINISSGKLECTNGVWTVVKRTEQTYSTPTVTTGGVQNFFYGTTDAVNNITSGGAMIGIPNEDTHKKPDTTPE